MPLTLFLLIHLGIFTSSTPRASSQPHCFPLSKPQIIVSSNHHIFSPIMSGNQALNVNAGIGGVSDIQITDHGSDWYFTVCAVMTASTLAFMGMSFTRPRTERLFHYITAAITMTAAISYFSMGANLGQVPIPVQYFRQGGGLREIFYVRYIDW